MRKVFYTNERRLVEAIIIQLALITVVGDHMGEQLPDNPLDEPLVKELTEVGAEIIPDLTVKDSKRLFRRVMPMKNLFLSVCDAGGDAPYYKQGLTTILFINNLIEQGAFFYEVGGRYDKVIQQVLGIFQASYEKEPLRRSAFKAAQRQLVAMQSHQYFTDVKWVLTDE